VADYKPRVLVDFDGVIHRYSKGWHDGTAYDVPMTGAREAINRMRKLGYDVVIFSTRDASQIAQWLEKYDFPMDMTITHHKLPAVAIIDDRAIHHIDWYSSLERLYDRYPIIEDKEKESLQHYRDFNEMFND